MFIKQISIFVENQPGRLAEITGILGQNGVDIRAVSIADTTDFGILRIVVDNPKKAYEVLKEADFTVTLTDVIAIGFEDRPGGLAEALNVLESQKISVEYMYAFISREGKTAYVILRVSSNEDAIRILQEKNVRVVAPEEIYNM
ncbi:ACT domain-containing protein [Candidatus Soleaferrea massiliensis]|uniref:ACT domain-containing protein n=1 Tax=Candidatus Soleaferrea massiliensis TaxID=1470354 RepID=UPI00058F16D7|nr:ACT domain-containing protein [Candidatus Soleaferrea massiliensis]